MCNTTLPESYLYYQIIMNISTLFFKNEKILRQDALGRKTEIVCCHQMVLHLPPDSFHRKAMAASMQVSVVADFYPILFQKCDDLRAVIFFFHYARYTGNSLYEDFAEEFLNEILENLHTETPISFKRGLAGIGWGMLYLIKQGFMETDIQETFKDMDEKVMEYNLLYMKDRSLETGAKGIGLLSVRTLGQ